MKKIIYLALVAVVFTSCLNGEYKFLNLSTVSGSMLECSKDTAELYVQSSSNFSVKSDQSWCKPEITQGQATSGTLFDCYVDANPYNSDRNATVTVTNEDYTMSVKIYQTADTTAAQ